MDRPSSSEPEEEQQMDRRSGSEPEEQQMDRRSSSAPEEEQQMDRPSSSEPEEEQQMDRPSSSEPEEEQQMDRRSSSAPEEEQKMDRRSSSAPEEEQQMDRRSSSAPEEEQQSSTEAESLSSQPSQETPEAGRGSAALALIELRRQQLHSRHVILLKMQQFWKRSKENSGRTKEEGSREDGDQSCELEDIQKELEKLAVKQEELQQQDRRRTDLSPDPDQEDTCSPSYKVDHVTPYGGIYTLPPPQATEQEVTSPETEPEAEKPTGPLTPVDSLALTPAVARCPSCDEVITTETCSKVGGTMWILCGVSAMLGCVAGCCLVPFFVDSLKDVHHQCPQCHSHIHTYHRL